MIIHLLIQRIFIEYLIVVLMVIIVMIQQEKLHRQNTRWDTSSWSFLRYPKPAAHGASLAYEYVIFGPQCSFKK